MLLQTRCTCFLQFMKTDLHGLPGAGRSKARHPKNKYLYPLIKALN